MVRNRIVRHIQVEAARIVSIGQRLFTRAYHTCLYCAPRLLLVIRNS